MFSYDTQKTRQFQQQNRDLELITEDGIFIRIFEDEHDWLVIMVEVGENVSNPTSALRNSASLVKKWKERLLKFQGAALWGRNGENNMLEGLLRMHKNGKSYNEIVKMVNRKLGESLREYLEYRVDIENKQLGDNQEFEKYFYNNPLLLYGLELDKKAEGMWRSRHTLLSLGMNDTEIEQEFRAGLENLKDGKKPALP